MRPLLPALSPIISFRLSLRPLRSLRETVVVSCVWVFPPRWALTTGLGIGMLQYEGFDRPVRREVKSAGDTEAKFSFHDHGHRRAESLRGAEGQLSPFSRFLREVKSYDVATWPIGFAGEGGCMQVPVEAYHFLSRASIPNNLYGTRRSSPKQQPEITCVLKEALIDKPFEINFAQIPPSRPDIGAHQYIDPLVDRYMAKRWPKCLWLSGEITLPDEDRPIGPKLARKLLGFTRKLLWTPLGPVHSSVLGPDQCAKVIGYRREYCNRQIYDIMGNRRPMSGVFVPTDIGEPVGPGFVSLPDVSSVDSINELVWSPILSFPDRTSSADDLPRICKKVEALRKHYNGYDELRDARRHLANNEIKAAIRSAASAIDAILRFYCDFWDVQMPKKSLQFDQKIENVLQAAGRPSYRSVEPSSLQLILYVYRARSSMHEGDCCYQDGAGSKIAVRNASQAEPFIEAVERFVVWIDSLP